jgi:hypothetical protein
VGSNPKGTHLKQLMNKSHELQALFQNPPASNFNCSFFQFGSTTFLMSLFASLSSDHVSLKKKRNGNGVLLA